MEPNSKLSEVIKAIGSSIRSMLSSFGLLKLNPTTGDGGGGDDGPISLLPNELMRLIFAKLELNGDVTSLVRLRMVSARWGALVEDHCKQKKSLIVFMAYEEDYEEEKNSFEFNRHFTELKGRFFEFVNLKDFTRLFLKCEISSKCLASVLKLFPNITHLSVSCFEEARIPDLVEYINSLDSLQQLDFEGRAVPALLGLSLTMSKLEHLSINIAQHSDNLGDQRVIAHLISHLGPNCARAHFGEDTYLLDNDIDQLFNGHWLTNLTHLRICCCCERPLYGPSENAKFVHFLGKRAPSLEHFSFIPIGCSYKSLTSLYMTPTTVGDLAKLSHLAVLHLTGISIKLPDLEQAAARQQLTPLSSVLECTLEASCYEPPDHDLTTTAAQLMHILSIIFPNLVVLELWISCDFETHAILEKEIERQLYRFPKLRKHYIRP